MNQPIVLCSERRDKAGPYIQALIELGVPEEQIRLVTPESETEGMRELAAGAAGLLVCGGPDIHPSRYGEDENPEADLSIQPELDAIEWELVTGAHEARTPVFGICRGMQVLNVFQGGTLYQDLKLELPGVQEHYVRIAPDHVAHTIHVVNGDLPIGDLLQRAEPKTNSRHHQAIKDMGRDLLPVAYSPDGVLEVVQMPSGGWWVWAVQWHPEDLVSDPQQRELWREFIAASRSHAAETAEIAGAPR